MGVKFDIINHHFMLEFVDSGLYFVQDEKNFINPLLQVGSESLGTDSPNKSSLTRGSDLAFGQIRIQGSVPRTEGDFKILLN